MTALAEALSIMATRNPCPCRHRRYGLSSKEFGLDCVLAVFCRAQRAKPKARALRLVYYDDISNLYCRCRKTPLPNSAKLEALFYGLGSDGAFPRPNNYQDYRKFHGGTPQGYFVYDPQRRAADGFSPSRERTADQFRLIPLPRLILLAATSCSLSINIRWLSV